MGWMSDEQYMMVSDSREKKSIAASAHKQRTHCGKCGSVKFPSDFMSKKELRAMNGECVKYPSLKKPMNWEEFKSLPDDLKVEYIKSLREKFNVPDKDIAAMFDVGKNTIFRWFKCLGLNKGMGSGTKTLKWDEEGFKTWLAGGENASVEPLEAVGTENTESTDIREDLVEEALTAIGEAAATVMAEMDEKSNEQSSCSHTAEKIQARPTSGHMIFNCPAEQALNTIRHLLGNARVTINIAWDVLEE